MSGEGRTDLVSREKIFFSLRQAESSSRLGQAACRGKSLCQDVLETAINESNTVLSPGARSLGVASSVNILRRRIGEKMGKTMVAKNVTAVFPTSILFFASSSSTSSVR